MDKVYEGKQNCCGCSACSELCPQNAIKMTEDEEGFYYPVIDKNKCVGCGLCKKVCRFKPWNTEENHQTYVELKSKNDEERLKSRSGGTFITLAKEVVRQKGIVYGVAFVNGCNVDYVRAETYADCKSMQGSKYVECSAMGIFPSVRDDLENGRIVLFSGTACQVAGLYGYLSVNKTVNLDNLITIDIVCHGVPSKKVYTDYIKYIENKYKGKVEKFNFRDKSYGWRAHVETFVINNRTYTRDTYVGLFYSNLFLRPSCGNCQFANFNRPADITIADFLGIDGVKNGFDDNLGVSIAIVNTDKGRLWIDKITPDMYRAELTKANSKQPNLMHPSAVPADRQKVWDYYHKHGFKKMMKKYGRCDILHRLKWRFVDYPKLKKYF